MASMADEMNIQNTFVAILKQYPILLNKSQLPIIKEEKTKALQNFCIKLEENLGRKFTPQQVQKKIQNMKTEVRRKTDGKSMGNQKIKLWEEEFLQLLDGESNPTINWIPEGLLMESDSNNVLNSDNHQVDMKIKIKEEPNGTLTQVKSEGGGFETVFVSSDFAKECPSDSEIDSNETCKRTEIKEEPHWSESTSHEIKQEVELPSSPDADLKEPVSDTEVITGDVATEEASRLYRESVCGSKHSVSCFFTNEISDENAWGGSDNDIDETSYLLSPGQTQIHEESPKALTQHELLQEGKKLLTCEVFKKNFTQLSNLNEHKLIHDGKRRYTCDICDKSFTHGSTLKEHKLIHAGIKPYTCDICNKSFTHGSTMKEHKLIHEGTKPHTCDICNKSFTHLSTMKQHKLIHVGMKRHTCEICNKSFTHGSTMKQHKLIHEGMKPHTCEICNKSFTHGSTMKQHKLIHEGTKPHTCEICNKAFTQSSQLKQHKLIHAGIKPHTCEICNKSFTHASSIRRHKLMHEGIKSYTCEICNKSFTQSSSLKKHKLIHDGIKPYSCEICNKDFTRMSYLKNHKIIAHL